MYKLIKSTSELITSTRSKWIEQTNSLGDFGVMVADDVNNILDGIEADTTEYEHTYFLTEEEDTYGRAILKVMHALPGSSTKSWLKLLKIRLEPNLNLEGRDGESERDAGDMYHVLASAIILAIGLIFQNNVNKLKIYGRTSAMRNMFIALLTDKALKSSFQDKGLSARREGSWLVVEKN